MSCVECILIDDSRSKSAKTKNARIFSNPSIQYFIKKLLLNTLLLPLYQIRQSFL